MDNLSVGMIVIILTTILLLIVIPSNTPYPE